MLLSCLKFCISVAHQAPTTLTLSMFFNILKSFPPQGLCTCGLPFAYNFCSRRPRGEGNTSIWPQLLLSWVCLLDPAFQPNRRTVLLLNLWGLLCGTLFFYWTFNPPWSSSSVPQLLSSLLPKTEHSLTFQSTLPVYCIYGYPAWFTAKSMLL